MSDVWVVHPNEYEADVAFVAESMDAALMRIDQRHQGRGPWTSHAIHDGSVTVQDRDGLYRYVLESYPLVTLADSLTRTETR